jgi:hypothetical protein
MSTLPNIKLVRNLAGETYFQPEGAGPYQPLGHMEALSTTATPTASDIFTALSGSRVLADTDITESRVSGTAVLRETGTRQLALAFMANEAVYTQAAATGLIASGTARMGDTIDLGRLDVTITTITDGTDPLLPGPDGYTLDAAAGMLTFNVDTEYDVVFAAAAITSGDNMALIAGLSASQGRVGRIRLVQRQPRGGKRYMWTAMVRIRPDGAVQLHNDAGDKITLPVAFDVIEDTTMPFGQRHGILVELPA